MVRNLTCVTNQQDHQTIYQYRNLGTLSNLNKWKCISSCPKLAVATLINPIWNKNQKYERVKPIHFYSHLQCPHLILLRSSNFTQVTTESKMNGDKTWKEMKMRKTQKHWSKFTLGAAMGYSSGKKSSNLKTPPRKLRME